jgi:hypothetical protein
MARDQNRFVDKTKRCELEVTRRRMGRKKNRSKRKKKISQ